MASTALIRNGSTVQTYNQAQFNARDDLRIIQIIPSESVGAFTGTLVLDMAMVSSPGNNDWVEMATIEMAGHTENNFIEFLSSAVVIRARITKSVTGSLIVYADSANRALSGSHGTSPSTLTVNTTLKAVGKGNGFNIPSEPIDEFTTDSIAIAGTAYNLTEYLEGLNGAVGVQPKISGGTITSNANDINLLQGMAASGLTTAKFQTVSTALDTVSLVDLQRLAGVTSNVQVQLDALNASSIATLNGTTTTAANLDAFFDVAPTAFLSNLNPFFAMTATAGKIIGTDGTNFVQHDLGATGQALAATANVAAAETVLGIDTLKTRILYRGEWDASSGAFPSTLNTLTDATAKNEYFIVSTAGTVDGVTFTAGQSIRALVASASDTTYAANWVQETNSIPAYDASAALYFDALPTVAQSVINGMFTGMTSAPVAGDFDKLGDITALAADLNLLATQAAGGLTTADFDWLRDVTVPVATLNSALTGLTSSVAELNYLDGAPATTTADLTKLSAVTSSSAELNLLDGATMGVADLNVLTGVSAAGLATADLVKLSNVQASAAEIDKLQGLTTTAADLGLLSGLVATHSMTGGHFLLLKDITATAADINATCTGNLTTAADRNLMAGMQAYGLVTADLQKLADTTVTSTEMNYLGGITGPIQAQIDAVDAKINPEWWGSNVQAPGILATDAGMDITIAVAGVLVADQAKYHVDVSMRTGLINGIVVRNAYISADGIVTIQLSNTTAGSVDPGTISPVVKVTQFTP